jgi:hypothetical protein
LPPISESTLPKPQINEPKVADTQKRKDLGASYLDYVRSLKKAKKGSKSERQSPNKPQDKLPLIKNSSVTKSKSKSHFRLKTQVAASPRGPERTLKSLAATGDSYKKQINHLNKIVAMVEKTKTFDMQKLPMSHTESRISDGRVRRQAEECQT